MFLLKTKNNLNFLPASRKRGFTLIEALVFLFIFALVTITFYATWSVSTRYIIFVKNRFVAVSLASEKMEVVRNLPYDKIAHTGGDPPGNLHEDETITRAGREFHVHADIIYVDDPLDGTLGGSPNDADFVDYKNVRIEVFWDGDTHSVVLVSRFVPAGVESPATGLGVLVINVFSDQSGSNVADSTVHITNSDTGYNETRPTDSFGRLLLVGLSASTQKYQIALAKTGYEAVETLSPYPTTSYDPTDEHASVIAAAVNILNIIQNKTANLKIKTLNYLGESAASMDFYLKGGRVMGMTMSDPIEPVYKINEYAQTEADGEKDFNAISPGQYEFSLEEIGYTVIGLDTLSPLTLASEQTKTINIKVSPNNVTAVLFNVKDESVPIAGASVRLTNAGGYDTTLTTNVSGLAFFPVVANPPFAAGTYDFAITASGYTDFSGQVTVNENVLENKTVAMEIIP
jgi:hypothetical protein